MIRMAEWSCCREKREIDSLYGADNPNKRAWTAGKTGRLSRQLPGNRNPGPETRLERRRPSAHSYRGGGPPPGPAEDDPLQQEPAPGKGSSLDTPSGVPVPALASQGRPCLDRAGGGRRGERTGAL